MEAKLISHMTTDEKLNHIINQQHALDKKVDDIQDGLLGDRFGNKGLVKQFEGHENLDNQRHEENSKRLDTLTKSFNDEKSFRKGAIWILGGLIVLVNIIIAILK